MNYGFPKPEHLTLQRDIDALFSVGSHSMAAYPIRIVCHEVEWEHHGPRIKVLVSVSKRKFKHAVDRNRAKRQMREAYRLNKAILLQHEGFLASGKALHLGFIWLADEPQDSAKVHKRIANLLTRICEKFA